jgi:carboxymethylenebutenolidase
MGRRGLARELVVAALGLAVGASGSWLVGHHLARRSRPPVTTHSEWVTIGEPSGDSLRVYVAYPERKDKAPAVILIHEIFGLSQWEPTVADKLAGTGYVVIVPDLLSSRFGRTPADPDSGRKLTALLDPRAITADLDAAFAYVSGLPAVRSEAIGVIGFCWGGGQSFRYATINSRLKAAVVCYGPPPDSAALAGVQARLLGVYGEDDARIDATLPDLSRQLRTLGKPFQYDIYPGTGHGFLRPGRKGSEGAQPERAWSRILAFYAETIGK